MVVIWSALAEEQLNNILDYYLKEVSFSTAQTILETLICSANRLTEFPCLGKLIVENPLYRVLVEGHYKIIYSIEEESIRIAFLFDSRQDPDKLLSFLR